MTKPLTTSDFIQHLTPRWNKYIPIVPHPKQRVFLLTDHISEVMYGGAARGGKSVSLLAAALQYADVPGYNALIFRRTFSDLELPDGLMDLSRRWLGGTDAKWKDDSKRWTFPSGATLTFGYMESANDRFRYQGSQLAFCGFDELTHFPEICYTYMFSRLCRVVGHEVPLRMRAASNPGGIGHEWVRRRFISEGHDPKERLFVPAGLRDNPSVDQDSYIKSLSNLDATTRDQLLNGNWDAVDSGGKFEREWFNGKIVKPHEVPRLTRQVWFVDLAASEPSERNPDPDWTVALRLGISENMDFYVLDVRRMRGKPAQVEGFVAEAADETGFEVDVFIEQEPGSGGVNTVEHYKRRVLPGHQVVGVRASGQGNKEKRANPASSAAQNGRLYLVRGPWVSDFLTELVAFPQGGHDDQVDALSGAYQKLARRGGDMTIGTPDNFAAAQQTTTPDPEEVEAANRGELHRLSFLGVGGEMIGH